MENNPNNYISLQEATKYCQHSQEYLSLRARQGKLKAVKFGRNWVTKKEWLEDYLKNVEEYNNNFKARKIAVPPKNLPIEMPTLKPVPLVRFGLIVALVFVLLAAGCVFGKESFKNVYRDIEPYTYIVGGAGDIIVEKTIEVLVETVSDIPQSLSRTKLALVRGFVTVSENVSQIVGNVSLTTASIGDTFKEYGQWVARNTTEWFSSQTEEIAIGISNIPGIFSEGYFAANDFLEKKISQTQGRLVEGAKSINEGIKFQSQRIAGTITKTFKVAYRFITQPWRLLPEKIVEKVGIEEIEELKAEIEKFKKEPVIVKEVEKVTEITKITKVEPIKEITKETIITKIDEEELAKIKIQIAEFTLWGTDIEELRSITKKLQATPTYTPAPSAPIYIGYQGIQVGGTGTFASLGVSGSAGIGNLGVGSSTSLGSDSSDTLSVNATSYFKAPVTFGTGTLTVDTLGNLSTTGNITTTGTGDLTVAGDLAVSGTQTFTGAATFATGTFTGNVNAELGLDVSGADFTYTGTAGSWTIALADSALTQTGAGLVTFTGNVDATSGLDVTGASLTVGDGGAQFTVTTTGAVTGGTYNTATISGGTLSGGTLSGGTYSGTGIIPTGAYTIGDNSTTITIDSSNWGVSSGGAITAQRITLNAPSDYSGNILDVQSAGTSGFSIVYTPSPVYSSLYSTPVIVDDGTAGGGAGLYASVAAISSTDWKIAYCDYSSGSGILKAVQCTSADCSTHTNPVTVDNNGDIGENTSVAAISSTDWKIAYYDWDNYYLHAVQCTNADCSEHSNPVTIGDPVDLGDHESISIALVSSNDWKITAYNYNTNDLAVVQCTSADCSTHSGLVTVDSDGNVGHYASAVAVSSTDWKIAYYDHTNKDLKVVQCTSADCSTHSNPVTVDSGGDVGRYVSITAVSSTDWKIAYYDHTNKDLKVVQCTSADCSTHSNPVTVDSGGDVGAYRTSVTAVSSTDWKIAYYDHTNKDLKVVQCISADCSIHTNPVAIDDMTANYNWAGISAVAISSADWKIAYYDDAGGDLKAVQITSPSGSEQEATFNVGIGTTVPVALLDVNASSIYSALDVTQSGSGTIVDFSNATGTVLTLANNGSLTLTGDFLPATTITYNLGSAAYKWANIYASTGTFGSTITIGTDTITGSGTTTFSTDAGSIILNPTGNVGIGTTTPNSILDLKGSTGIILNRGTAQSIVDDSAVAAPASAQVYSSAAGVFDLATGAGNNTTALNRLSVSNATTAVATWSDITHSGLILSGALDANSQQINNIDLQYVNYTNLLENGDFEVGDPPTGWTLVGADASLSRSSAQAKIGTYSLLLTRAGTNCVAYQDVTGYAYYTSRKVTGGAWVYATVASRARLQLTSAVAAISYSDYHSGGSAWEWLTVTHTVDATPLYLRLACRVDTGDTSAHFDGAILVEGDSCPAFSPRPSTVVWKDAPEQALTLANQTTDTAWTDLDLTAYTSANAKFVILELTIHLDSWTSGWVELKARKNGTAPSYPVVTGGHNDAAAFNRSHLQAIVGLDSGQVIEYMTDFSDTAQADFDIFVFGYIE